MIAHRTYKNQWAKISDSLKGRSSNMVKNKFYSIFRKVKSKIRNGELDFSSKLELLEMNYITDIVLNYIDLPRPSAKKKGKRGKDFIFTLIEGINEYFVKDYKKSLNDIAKTQGNIDSLFEELKHTSKLKHLLEGQTKEVPIKSKEKKKKKVNEHQENKTLEIANNKEEVKKTNVEIVAPQYQQPVQKLPLNYFDKMKQDIQPLNNIHQEIEPSPYVEYNPISPPQFLFSPANLSAGPSAIANTSVNAACFNPRSIPTAGGFTEISNNLSNGNAYPLIANGTPTPIPNNTTTAFPQTPHLYYYSHEINEPRFPISPAIENQQQYSYQVLYQSPLFQYISQNNQQINKY